MPLSSYNFRTLLTTNATQEEAPILEETDTVGPSDFTHAYIHDFYFDVRSTPHSVD